jgi:hypothetical protein
MELAQAANWAALLYRGVAGPPGTGARSIAEIVDVDARNSNRV